jgi:hypothetical protein
MFAKKHLAVQSLRQGTYLNVWPQFLRPVYMNQCSGHLNIGTKEFEYDTYEDRWPYDGMIPCIMSSTVYVKFYNTSKFMG